MHKLVSKLVRTFLLSSVLCVCTITQSATYYIDPENGSALNTGSANSPWRTLQEVIDEGRIESTAWRRPYSPQSGLEIRNEDAPVKGGDTLVLRSGYHGKVNIHRYINDKTINIIAAPGHTPRLSQLHFQSAARWSVSGVSISPSYGDSDQSSIVRIESHGFNGPSSHISIVDNDIFSAQTIDTWSAAEWLSNAKNGISVDGDHSTIIGNTVRNIAFGITVGSDHVTVRDNSIINFSGDGLRGLGDYGLFEYNMVANAFKVNSNHDDGFQSWSRDGKPVIGVVLRGNQFYTNYNHPNPALLSTFQGIGCFDGYYNNWVIENNLVAVSHWHGISVYGANNTRIVNNTVVDDPRYDDDRMVPWIRLTTHKNGSNGTGNVVRNNVGRLASTDKGVVIDHNLEPAVQADDHSAYDALFINRFQFNYFPRRSSSLIGAGSSALAPAHDMAGRPRADRIDLGALQLKSTDLPFLFLLLDGA